MTGLCSQLSAMSYAFRKLELPRHNSNNLVTAPTISNAP